MLPLGSRDIVSFTCFWAAEGQLAAAIKEILPRYTAHRIGFRTASMFPCEQYYHPKGLEVSLWHPGSPCPGSIFFPNLQDGWYSLVRHLVARFHFRAVSVRVSPLTVPDPICELILHLNSSGIRIVRVMRDSKRWEFFAEGPTQAFEQPAAYDARVIKQRFTQAMLESYMSSLGWPISQPEFWKPLDATITTICS